MPILKISSHVNFISWTLFNEIRQNLNSQNRKFSFWIGNDPLADKCTFSTFVVHL